jgi:CHASE2 domain-containing sensor protein
MSPARILALLPPWLARPVRALPFLIGASVLTLLLDSTGALRKLETGALDLQASLGASAAPSPVALVRISKEDYLGLFGGRSPLDPRALRKIIDAIAVTSPAAIIVNVDTAAPAFGALRFLPAMPPVVWARGAGFSRRRDLFLAEPYLGGTRPGHPAGLTPQKVEADGVIRRYQHLYRTDQGPLPSLAWATVCAVRRVDPIRTADPRNEFFLRFGISRPPFQPTAGAVLQMARDARWRSGSLLTGKLVVLGGEYSVEDEHETPVGWKLGSEIIAQAIETELAGEDGRIAPVPLPVLLLLQIVQGVLFLLLFQALRLQAALVASLLVVPGLAATFSLGTFGTVSHWGWFAPILLAVLGQQVYEKARKARSELVESAAGALRPGSRTVPRSRKRVAWWRPRRRKLP